MSEADGLNLAQALQRAFIEADTPTLASVADRTGVSRQRLSAWRAGRHLPAEFADVEPVIAYLRLIADVDGNQPARAAERVTSWSTEQWRQAWQRSTPPQPSLAGKEPEFDRRPLAIAVMSLLVFLVAALAVMAFLLSWAYR